MRKTILASVIGATAFTALVSGQALAQEYFYRYPIANASNDDGSGGSGGSGGGDTDTGGGETDPTTDPAYCDLNQNLVDQWVDAGVTSSYDTDSMTFLNPKLQFTGGTNDLNGSQLPLFPRRCFETIEIRNFDIDSLDFLTNATKGDTLLLDNISIYQAIDYSGVRNIVELNELYVNPEIGDHYINNSVKIPYDAWLCQPEQEGIFTGIPQEVLCAVPPLEPLAPWEQYAFDLTESNPYYEFSYENFDNLVWNAPSGGYYDYFELIKALPDSDYPIETPSLIELTGFKFTNIGGLASISSIDTLYIDNDNLTDLSNFDFIVNNEIYLTNNIHYNENFVTIPADSYLCQPENSSKFTGASQSDVCPEVLEEYVHTWENFYYVTNEVGVLDPLYTSYNFIDGINTSRRALTKYGDDFEAPTKIPNGAQDMYPESVIERLSLTNVQGDSFSALSNIQYASNLFFKDFYGSSVLELVNLNDVESFRFVSELNNVNPVSILRFPQLNSIDFMSFTVSKDSSVNSLLIDFNNSVTMDVNSSIYLTGVYNLSFLNNIQVNGYAHTVRFVFFPTYNDDVIFADDVIFNHPNFTPANSNSDFCQKNVSMELGQDTSFGNAITDYLVSNEPGYYYDEDGLLANDSHELYNDWFKHKYLCGMNINS